MNLPNKLSISRIILIIPFLFLALPEDLLGLDSPGYQAVSYYCAFLLAVAVAITDWLDGVLARKMQLVTNFGKLIDPLADKIFVTAGFVAFVQLGVIPAWAVMIIIAREFLVTGLRLVAAEKGRVIAADKLGKHKTAWQLAVILGTLLFLGIETHLVSAGAMRASEMMFVVSRVCIWAMLTVALFLTIESGWKYLFNNKDVLLEDGV